VRFFIVLAFEPALSWFVVPAALAGLAVALFLRSSNSDPSSARDEARPEIQISKIPVRGGMGLVFTAGTIAIFCIALPEARWFLALAIPAGIVVGVVLNYWHSRRV
jgi:cytosine/uracil/thiamine/allantoin permease